MILCGYATSPIQERQPPTNQSAPHGCHINDISKGPPSVQTDSKSRVHLGCTQGPTCQSLGEGEGDWGP
jgi:hypothetical protein